MLASLILLHPCVSLRFISLFSICPSVYVSVSLVLPLKTPDLTLKGGVFFPSSFFSFFFFVFLFFRLITLGIFPAFEQPFLGGGGGGSDSDSSIPPTVHTGESHANYPGYWLPQRRGCDLHEVTFSSNIQTFAPLIFVFFLLENN